MKGYAPLKSGVVRWPIAVSLLLLAMASAPLAQKLGLRAPTCIGLTAVVAGVVLLGRLGPHSGYPVLAVAVCVVGGGPGVIAPAATSAITDNVPPDKYGVASAGNDATREIGAALGIALAGNILSATYTDTVSTATAALPAPARQAAGRRGRRCARGRRAVRARRPRSRGGELRGLHPRHVVQPDRPGRSRRGGHGGHRVRPQAPLG